MSTLEDLVQELAQRFPLLPNSKYRIPPGPSLIARLEDPKLRTSQPSEQRRHQAPGSRPPTSVVPMSEAVQIKAEAIALFRETTRSTLNHRWDRALLHLPTVTPAGEPWERAHRTVGEWHTKALTVLGFQDRPRDMPYVTCVACNQTSVRYRPAEEEGGETRAWCTNPDCIDRETERPARYDWNQVLLLTRSVA